MVDLLGVVGGVCTSSLLLAAVFWTQVAIILFIYNANTKEED